MSRVFPRPYYLLYVTDRPDAYRESVVRTTSDRMCMLEESRARGYLYIRLPCVRPCVPMPARAPVTHSGSRFLKLYLEPTAVHALNSKHPPPKAHGARRRRSRPNTSRRGCSSAIGRVRGRESCRAAPSWHAGGSACSCHSRLGAWRRCELRCPVNRLASALDCWVRQTTVHEQRSNLKTRHRQLCCFTQRARLCFRSDPSEPFCRNCLARL